MQARLRQVRQAGALPEDLDGKFALQVRVPPRFPLPDAAGPAAPPSPPAAGGGANTPATTVTHPDAAALRPAEAVPPTHAGAGRLLAQARGEAAPLPPGRARSAGSAAPGLTRRCRLSHCAASSSSSGVPRGEGVVVRGGGGGGVLPAGAERRGQNDDNQLPHGGAAALGGGGRRPRRAPPLPRQPRPHPRQHGRLPPGESLRPCPSPPRRNWDIVQIPRWVEGPGWLLAGAGRLLRQWPRRGTCLCGGGAGADSGALLPRAAEQRSSTRCGRS